MAKVKAKRKGRAKSITRGPALQVAERRAFAVECRKRGWTFRVVSAAVLKRFGDECPSSYDERFAFKDVMAELQRTWDMSAEDTAAIRTLELERLDRMWQALWDRLVSADSQSAEVDRAVDRLLRIQERRSKLLGLDAPTKVATTDTDGKDVERVVTFYLPAPPRGEDAG